MSEKIENTQNENTQNDDVEIEPLSDKDMEEIAGGTYQDNEDFSAICSISNCS